MDMASGFVGLFGSFGKGSVMRCLACDCRLSDREANRKYANYQEIKNPESRYIMLCDDCIQDTDLNFVETQLDGEELEAEKFDSEMFEHHEED